MKRFEYKILDAAVIEPHRESEEFDLKYEVKLEKSVKIILAVFAVGIFLNAFATPIAQEMFGIKPALAESLSGWLDIYVKQCSGC